MKHANRNRHDLLGWALHAAGFLTVALVLGVFYALGYARWVEQSETNAQRTVQLGKLLETSADVQRQYNSLRQELDELDQVIAAMRKRLPDQMLHEEFESEVRRVAAEAGFQLNHTTWQPPQISPSHSHEEVVVRGVGGFASICRFLDEISHLARLTRISQLELETDANSNRYPLQVTFLLVYGVESHDIKEKRESL